MSLERTFDPELAAARDRLGIQTFPDPEQAWIVHSANGVTALAWPIHPPINDEAAPADTGTAPYKTHDNSEGVTTP